MPTHLRGSTLAHILQFPYAVHVAPAWENIAGSSSVRTMLMDEARYELLRKVFYCFACRTIASSPRGRGQEAILVKHNIDQYFTRAIIYPLYSDPDIYVHKMGIGDKIQELMSQQSSGQVPQDESSSAISPQQKSQTSKEGRNERKCSYCGTQSDAVKKCSRCGEAQYCGQDCQRKHWKEHKLVCHPQSATHPNTQTVTTASAVQSQEKLEGDAVMKEAGNKKCSFCGTLSDDVKKCSQCGEAQYCRQDCQKKHWKKHKLICNLQSATHPNTQTVTTASAVQSQEKLEGDAAMKEAGNKKCSFCGSQSDDLKKCSRCGEAQYCGLVCQRKHWKEHKQVCNPQRVTHPNTQTFTTASAVQSQEKLEFQGDAAMKEAGNEKCSFCGSRSDDLKKCSHCGEAQYCGQDCQKKHWKWICNPQSATHPNTQTATTVSAVQSQEKLEGAMREGGNMKCSFCGIQPNALKKCSRCGEAQYCGQSCQRKHWKEHKLVCGIQKESHFNIQTSKLPAASSIAQNIAQHKCEGCEKEFSSLRKCQCHQVAYCSVECQRKDWQKHKDVCTVKTSRIHR